MDETCIYMQIPLQISAASGAERRMPSPDTSVNTSCNSLYMYILLHIYVYAVANYVVVDIYPM